MTDQVKKFGRPPKDPKKRFFRVKATVSPTAYQNYLAIPAGERSRRISKFLERCNPNLIMREPGERED